MNERDIFIGAIQRDDPAQRRQFVHEACGADEALRRRVEDLLSVYNRGSAFPESPVARPEATLDQPSTSEAAGGVIGPYKLLEPIGEGGMGTIWMAQQTEPVKRVVALKLIKAGMDSRQIVARFEAERQALALMDHPNIAKVFDAGAASNGRPYFVMELVKGVPITRYCDDHQLTPRQRLELFVPVCQAVQHAHQKGVIHRDLKPSNILVALYDDRPVPKIIDFGVAKATGQQLTERTLHTGFGAVVGTVEYMSPEQATFNQLDIDTRSDIYSLGALLYELLAGSPPFTRKELTQAGMLEMLRVIREQEPAKPSTKLSTAEGLPTLAANRGTEPAKLTRLVRGELDWIVMKALEKDRNRRYETANGFAMDVQRYLADEVVAARPPSAAYRFRKFLRRNRGPVAVAIALAVSLLAGVVAVAAVQRKADRDRVAAETDRATRQAGTTASIAAAVREARERSDEAWTVIDYPDRMQLATDAAVAAVRRADGYAASGSPTDETLAELAFTRQVVDDLARHTSLITALAHSQWKFADDLTGMNAGLARTALCDRHAEALRQFGLDPVNGRADEVAQAVAASRIRDPLLGMLLEWQLHAAYLSETRPKQVSGGVPDSPNATAVVADRLAQAIRSARQGCGGPYARWQELLDRNDVPGLVAFAASPEGLRFRSNVVNALARDLRSAKQYAACRDFLRAAVDRYPRDVWLHNDLALMCGMVNPPDHLEALRHLSAASVQRPDSAFFHLVVGERYSFLAAYDHAVTAYRKSISLCPDSAIAHLWMGNALLKKQDAPGALAAYREAMRLRPAGAEDPRTLVRYNAACAAMRCADGRGPNAPPAPERPGYRKQALDFLTADLAAIRKLPDTDRAFVQRMMQHWLKDEDLASVRDPMAVEKLPPDERDAWKKLWADVRDLRDRTAPQDAPPAK
jgi:serine/threonine protein kinase